MLFYKLELGTLALVKKLSKSYVIYITHFRNAIYMIKKCFSFFNEEDFIHTYIYIYISHAIDIKNTQQIVIGET